MLSAFLLGIATLCWPSRPSATRLKTLLTPRKRRAIRPPRPTTFIVALSFGAAGYVLSGLASGLAAALAAVTAWRRWQARHELRTRLSTVDGLAEALRSMVAELRAGAHPATAAESAAVDAHPSAARAMRAVAAAARLDGDVHRALTAAQAKEPALRQLSRAWTLASRHGLPLAEVLDAVRGDLQARVRFARQVLARMAGPRASATILALLPAFGLALGEAMGAHPLHVLTGTAPGQLLLLIGVALACAGVAWSARLTSQVVLP